MEHGYSINALIQSDRFQKDVRPLLDMVDDVRGILGNEEGVTLPSIAVIGQQSAGKTTVIERLSGIQLPRGEGMKTKCPLVMRLRKSKNGKESIRIGRDLDNMVYVNVGDISGQVDNLTEEISTTANGEEKKFGVFMTTIHLEITRNDLEDLTLIDLPGIFSIDVNTKQKLVGVEDFLKKLYLKYIDTPECIIVCVVPATSDLGTQTARGWATEVDPKGLRSLGVLTQVDRVPTKDTFNRILDIGVNSTNFSLGVVALRNNHQPKDAATLLEEELDFFRTFHSRLDISEPLPTSSFGLGSLVETLVRLQAQRVSEMRPKLKKLVLERLEIKNAQLRAMPIAVKTDSEALNVASKLFEDLNQLFSKYYLVEYPHKMDDQLKFQPRLIEWCESFQKSVEKRRQRVFSHQYGEKITALHKDYRGHEMDDISINKIFSTLMSDCIDQMRDPALVLIDAFTGFMRGVMKRSVEITIQPSCKELASEVSSFLEDHLTNSQTKCKNRVKKLLRIEVEQIFTVNHYYAETFQKITGAKVLKYIPHVQGLLDRERLNTVTINANTDVSTDDEFLVRLEQHVAEQGKLPPQQQMSTDVVSNLKRAVLEMQCRVFAYRKVVEKRFIDIVCLYCRDLFCARFYGEIAKMLRDAFKPEELFKMLQEDAITKAKRLNIKKSIHRLEKALERIKNLFLTELKR